ncbi:unnamed protein product [Ranitomeya imitator]|uniref:Uncharacterized protein n=1 Tax=Ranitomeya imitator TaxID=111125 RepID=A0ABN9LE23_9NEOB|nr:unnamed protein product [Ranitomeya imitator]
MLSYGRCAQSYVKCMYAIAVRRPRSGACNVSRRSAERTHKRTVFSAVGKRLYFDTHAVIQILEAQGFTTQQSEMIVSALLKILNANMDLIYQDMVSKVQQDGNQGKHRVTKRGPALSYPMFTLVTGIVGRWRAVCVTALQRPNSDAAVIQIVVGIAAASLSVTEISLQQVMSHIASTKKDMIILEKSEFSALRTENERLKSELEQLKKQSIDEITKVRANNKLDFNLEKSRVKEMYADNERKLVEHRTEIVEMSVQLGNIRDCESMSPALLQRKVPTNALKRILFHLRIPIENRCKTLRNPHKELTCCGKYNTAFPRGIFRTMGTADLVFHRFTWNCKADGKLLRIRSGQSAADPQPNPLRIRSQIRTVCT